MSRASLPLAIAAGTFLFVLLLWGSSRVLRGRHPEFATVFGGAAFACAVVMVGAICATVLP